jgi:HEAT repeat protein
MQPLPAARLFVSFTLAYAHTTFGSLILGVFVVAWLALFACVVLGRAEHDTKSRILGAARRAAQRRIARAARADSEIEVDRILERLSVRTLLRAAADTSMPSAVARVFSRHLVRRAEPQIRAFLVADARESARWKRLAALRVAALGGLPDAKTVLESAVRSSDDEVRSAGVRILGELATAEADAELVETLVDGTVARSRVAAQLDGHNSLSVATLRPLLASTAPIVRYWGAKLLAHVADRPETSNALLAAASDTDAGVRAAAAESLGRDTSRQGAETLTSLAADGSQPVRIHAARSIGRRGTFESAAVLAPLLYDRDWWVRTAAKRALERVGLGAIDAVSPLLGADDEFARNGAAEVLQNIGRVRELVDRVSGSGSPDAAADLSRIFTAGGDRFATLSLDHLEPADQARVRAVVDRAA